MAYLQLHCVLDQKVWQKHLKQKVDTAELLFETGKKYGLKIEQFIFDVLTFTLATGEDEFLNAGKNTLGGN